MSAITSVLETLSQQLKDKKTVVMESVESSFLDDCFDLTCSDQILWWKAKGSQQRFLGVGPQLTLKTRPELERALDKYPHIFGAMAFDSIKTKTSQLWQDYHPIHFIVPEYLLVNEGNKLTVHHTAQHPSPLTYYFGHTDIDQSKSDTQYPFKLHHESSSLNEWNGLITKALKQIQDKKGKKVVLSRMSHYKSDVKINPQAIFKRARAHSSNTYEFYFQLNKTQTFLSLTPETLYKKNDHDVTIDALAGTKARSAHPDQDYQLGQDLLASDKDLREHEYVCEHIENNLKGLGTIARDQTTLLKLSTVQHIHTPIKLKLKKTLGPLALIDKLHPTPAVGGTPTEWAKKFIRECEPYERGLYAAPIGHLSLGDEEFAVAIRSILIDHNDAYLFGGCGIVEGSDPQQEWQESQDKTKHLLQALTGVKEGHS